MIHRATLHALERAASEGKSELVYQTLVGFDPLVRAWAGRRARSAILQAGALTGLQDETHVVRLAFVTVARRGNPVSDYDDQAGVASEYQSLRSGVKPPPRGPVVVISLLLLVLCVTAGTIAKLVLFRPFDAHDVPGAAVMAEHVPQHVIAVSQGDAAAARSARDAATDSRAREALGDETTDALDTMLAATEALANAPLGGEKATYETFVSASTALNLALERNAHPFFVDADTYPGDGRVLAVLLTFYVEREVKATSDKTGVRCAHLRRLDNLDVRQGYLGYTRPTTPAAIVLLDQIEQELVELVLPALPAGEPMDIVDVETELDNEPWVGAVRFASAKAIQAHYATMPAEHTEGVDRVGKLIARRRALVKSWRATIADLGMLLKPPRRLIPDPEYTDQITHLVRGQQLRDWDDVHDELLKAETLAAFNRLRDRYAESVQRHEIQHWLDYQRGLMPYPEVLQKLLPTETPMALESQSLRGRARDELSAYLAQIAQSPDSPLLPLVMLSAHAFNKHGLGGAYSYAALAAMDAISAQLGIDFWAEVNTPIAREDVAKVFLKVVAKPPDDVRQAAGRAYEKAFQQPVPTVVLQSVKQNEPWLH